MLHGLGVSPGIGIADALIWQQPVCYDNLSHHTEDTAKETLRFDAALARVSLHNEALAAKTQRRIGGTEADIFKAHGLILSDDEGILQPVHQLILENTWSAEYAVTQHFNTLARQMRSLSDEYMRQRAEDFVDLRDQIMRQLLGISPLDASHLDRPTVVVAYALSPSEISNLDHSRLAGIICETGGFSSHAAILARTLGIPAVLGVEDATAIIKAGSLVALDGDTGEIWLHPDEQELALLSRRYEQHQKRRHSALRFHGRPTLSRDGRRIELCANVSQLAEMDAAMDADAESIGLFRTELLHLNRSALPTEEQQLSIYRQALKKSKGKGIVFRTLDVDNYDSTLTPSHRRTPNPALGLRGIRMSLGRPGLFRPQLRALLRASAYGSMKIMFPMITHPREMEEAKAAVHSIMDELRRENLPFDEKIPLGIMLEVPGAALLAEEFAKLADFFFIGINDLVQFTLASDRGDPSLSSLQNLLHPAVLRLVRQITEAAHLHGLPCCLCGELGHLEHSIPLFLGLELDGLSLGPSAILPSRQIISECNYIDCRKLAIRALAQPSGEAVQQFIGEWLPKNFP